MAAIEKRGERQWRVRVRRRNQPMQTRTFDTKYEADAWARALESEMDRGSFRDQKEAESTTLSQALDRWRDEFMPKLAAKSQVSEMSRVRVLKTREISRLPLASVRGRDVAGFIRKREAEGCKPDTIRLDLARIGRVFVVARSAWGMEGLGNPVRDASTARPRIPGGRTRRVSPEEEALILEEAIPELRPVVRFALATAMRRSGLAELPWKQLQVSRKIATLFVTKNAESRTVPLSTKALSALEMVPRRDIGLVFGLSAAEMSKAFTKAVRDAGLEDLRFHDLRHEATSRLFETTDLDAVEIAKITGHKTMQMLARYTHLRAENLVGRLG